VFVDRICHLQGQPSAAVASTLRSSSQGRSSGTNAGRSSSGNGYAAVCKEEAGHVQIAVGEADTVRLMTGEPSVQVGRFSRGNTDVHSTAAYTAMHIVQAVCTIVIVTANANTLF
jgi:hypothetical protein